MGNIYLRIAPPSKRIPTKANSWKEPFWFESNAEGESVLAESTFGSVLTLERRRAERSRKPFVLMLLDANAGNGEASETLRRALRVVLTTKREIDSVGWYKLGAILGIIFTEVNTQGVRPITDTLRAKIEAALVRQLGQEFAERIAISVHLFPENWDGPGTGWVADSKLYPDLNRKVPRRPLPLAIKRAIDIAGSAGLLLAISPVLATIAALIKLTSKGPVIFQQERLGQFGERFQCLKFRTMYTGNDPGIHREFVHRFIAGGDGLDKSEASDRPVYKLTRDPRITSIGRFLRKASLDELPQFWNVLRGEMSLVGPRPPVPYEFEVYDIWHRRRILEVKPGVTGLWQVSGRSRTRFDEMVRLDLSYSRSWSIWLDLKILFLTPRAVLNGDGAC
jgi:lipopolysaccharide/colanic/teichoic acid biosynthesis glycosyltransferase